LPDFTNALTRLIVGRELIGRRADVAAVEDGDGRRQTQGFTEP
jgi:hypothetical protein